MKVQSHQIKSIAILRVFFFLGAAAFGMIQAWVGRFAMNPDGVSYLDIGDALWRGDWHMALNAYFSPLYPALLGLGMKILRPSPYWEFPVVHLVNFLIYLGALLSFDFFLRQFIQFVRRREDQGNVLRSGMSEGVWLTIGYLLFMSSSLLMISLDVVSPDMCVATCVYLAAAFLLRISQNPNNYANFIFLG